MDDWLDFFFVLQMSSGDLSLVVFSNARTFSSKQLSGFTPSRKARKREEQNGVRNFYEDILSWFTRRTIQIFI